MKKCPQCGRNYDETMSFCLDDGSDLLYGPASGSGPGDEPATAILSELPVSTGGQFSGENPTRPFIHTTAAETKPQKSWGGHSEKQSFSANRAAGRKASTNGCCSPLCFSRSSFSADSSVIGISHPRSASK